MQALQARFEITLLGYRNDLARERVIAFLRNLSPDLGGPIQLHRDLPLPHTLARGLEQSVALHLASQLRERGAQIHLRGFDAEAVPRGQAAPAAAPSTTRLLVLGACLLIVFALAQALRSHQPALPPAGVLSAVSEIGETRLRADVPLRSTGLNEKAVELNATGQFNEAVALLHDAIGDRPDEPVLRDNLTTVLRNWAVAEINAGRPASAVELLEEALQDTGHPALLALLGIAQERLGEWHAAEATLQRAIRMGAEDPMAFVALGRVYRQQGDQQSAVEMFHRARESGARGEDFDLMLERLERELDAEWDYVALDTAHFRLSFAQGENYEAAKVVSAVLEDAYFSVGRKLNYYPDLPTEVVLYPSEDFHEVTQTPDWTGGVYDGRIKLPVRGVEAESDLLERTLRHEYGHVLVTKKAGRQIPVWLNEGLAIWAEEEEDGDRLDWAYDTIAGRRLLSLEELNPPFTRLPADRVQVAYAQSYLAVRAILADHGERRLLALLEAAGSGNALDASFERVLATRLADFEARLIRNLTS